MEKKFKNHAVVGMCALGLIGLNSCLKVDETYDLDKDFDMTITVGGDLTVPGSSTEKIVLSDLLDLEDNSVIKVNNSAGDYYLVQDGETSSTNVNVPGVDINMTEGFTSVEQNFNIQAGTGGNLPEEEIEFKDIIEININENGITSDIKSISNAETSCRNTYLVFSKNTNLINAVLENGYTIEFPSYITVKSESPEWTAEGNVLKLDKADGLEITNSTKIKFQIVKVQFDQNEAVFTNNENEKDNNSVHFRGNISLDGNVKASAMTNAGGNITLSANVEAENMAIESATAVVDPEVDIKIDPIRIDDIPDFLAEEDVILDLTDPRIYITVTNPSPVAVNMGAALRSFKEGNQKGEAYLQDVNIPKECENYVICVNQKREEWDTTEKIMYKKVEGLSDLIKNIPDRIEITDVETSVVQEEVTIDLNKNYTIVTDYKVDTPLMFGPETTITYTEAIDGWDADLEDMEFDRVEASMNVINEIPLGVKMTAKAIDVNGNVLENVKVDMDAEIKAGDIGAPTTQKVNFTLTTDDGKIAGLDGIEISVVASVDNNVSDVTLNENQTMQFTEIKLRLVGGITMDLN